MLQINEREVWQAWVAYRDQPEKGKYRPVLVLVARPSEQEALIVPITSTPPRDEYDIELFDWADIPLDHISTARASQARVLLFADFRKQIGYVSRDDWDNVMSLYTEYERYHPWE